AVETQASTPPERLIGFTAKLATWANSARGQESIQHFFDVFANLHYSKIATFFTDAVAMFTAYRLAKWTSGNIFWATLLSFVKANPDGFATIMGAATKFIVDG